MRVDLALIAASLLSATAAVTIDGPRAVVRVDMGPAHDAHDAKDLYRRRGGGGSGGRGGSIGGGSSGAGGRSGGSGSGSRRSVDASPPRTCPTPVLTEACGGSGSNTQPSSNTGGTSRGGSGPVPGFGARGGGRGFYSGGGVRPYAAGGRSPLGILPFALVGVAALAFWPGVWLHGAYMYPYSHVHRFYNATTDRNETANVLCGCARFAVCGCDENNSTEYYDDLIGNGSFAALNKSVVNVGEYNGNRTLLINGTLPNGTTADGPDEGTSAAPGGGMRSLVEAAGFWPAVAAVVAAVYLS